MDAGLQTRDDAAVAAVVGRINSYNTLRQQTHSQVGRRVGIGMAIYAIAVVILLILVFAGGSPFGAAVVFTLGLLGFGALLKTLRKPVGRLQQQFRDGTMPNLFAGLDDVRYAHGSVPSSFSHMPRSAVGDFTHQTFGDCLAGSRSGMAFEIYEGSFARRAGSRGTTTFRGMVVAFKVEPAFPGVFVAINAPPGVRQPFFRDLPDLGGLKPLEAGDGPHQYRSDNEAAARALIGPALAAALDAMQQAWPQFPGRVAVAGDDAFMLIPTERDLFAMPPISVDCSYKQHVKPMLSEVDRLLDAAAALKAALESRGSGQI